MDYLHRISSFFRYLFKAQGKIRLHSPHVFDFYVNVLEDDRTFYAYREVELLRKFLSTQTKKLTYPDYGAVGNGEDQTKTIAQMVKNSAIPPKWGQLIFRIVNHYKCQNILELGTNLGMGTLYLAKAAPKGKVISIEGAPPIAEQAERIFEMDQVTNIQLVTGTFEGKLPDVLAQMPTVDLVFFDGNHTERATWNYFETCLPYRHNDTIFIFDDIHWSREMERVWKKIVVHPDVAVTVDLYRFGIVWFRKEQAPENFTLRYL